MEVEGYVNKEEESENVEACLDNLTIEIERTEEEVTEYLETALGKDVDVDGEGEDES